MGTTKPPPYLASRGAPEVIDFDGPVPIYRPLAAIIRGCIDFGAIPPARPIPSKKSLMQGFGIGTHTVDRAVDLLCEEGLIETLLGKACT